MADIDAITKIDIKSGKVEKTIVVDKAIFLNKRRYITRMIHYTLKKAKNCFLSQDLYSRLI